MWHGKMWNGLLEWCATDDVFQRELVLRRACASAIRGLIESCRASDFSCEEFLRTVCGTGSVITPDGKPMEPELLARLSPDGLDQMIRGGTVLVTGNYLLRSANHLSEVIRPRRESSRWPQRALPGLDCDERERRLRAFIVSLLESGSPPSELVAEAAAGDVPIAQMVVHASTITSLILSLCTAAPWAVLDDQRIRGLHRLESLTGIETGCARGAGDYERLGAAMEQMVDLPAGEADAPDAPAALDGPLAADLLLCRLAELRGPEAWKIAIGLSAVRSEEEVIASRCLDEGFAALAPTSSDDPNIARFQRLVPGDCVVMHLRGRIGAIGRVTRPFYEVDRESADALDCRWWRRVGVEWVEGDRDYGDLLSGAVQRFSVVQIESQVFMSIADLYRHDPAYDRIVRPLRGAWVFLCDEDRWQKLLSLERPLPLRDQWSVEVEDPDGSFSGAPEPGDTVYIYREESGADDETPAGLCGIAKVISDAGQMERDRNGLRRIDLLYEQLLEEPLPAVAFSEDALLDRWRPPEGMDAGWLPPEVAGAFSGIIGSEKARYFVLLSGASSIPRVRTSAIYRLNRRTGGCDSELVRTATDGGARCIIYHGRAENSLIGFGTVEEVCAVKGWHEVHLDMRTFARSVRISAGRFPSCFDSGAGGEQAGEGASGRGGMIRTVLPVSAYDFYRVIGAGMVTREAAEVASNLEEVAERTGAPPERLEQMERLLRQKGQMILYGPPGTGKTWLALHLAEYLTGGDDSRVEVVQFHPSYSYEDLIEGIRPRVVETAGGQNMVDYPLVPGSFKVFCNRAGRDLRNSYVFVIDEMNRARVEQVFGELMMALEYRGREVQLAHARAGTDVTEGAESFAVPPNLLVLATMNTADRSTALVDYALRRRFVFYPLYPDDPELVRPMFERWLSSNAPEAAWVAELQASLNKWLLAEKGRHLLIGHTYFMRDRLTEDDVREIWRFQLRPLLEEYFAGAPERLRELDIDDLIARARGADGVPSSAGALSGRLAVPAAASWSGEPTLEI